MSDHALLFWILLGVVLIFSELLIPGLVVIFLGIGALLVALGIWLGLLNGWLTVMTTWFMVSLALIFTLRNLFARLAPGDTAVENMDEDKEAIGTHVSVLKDVHPYDDTGRISFRGAGWQARCPATTLPAGSKARLVSREGNLWVVAPVEDNSSDPSSGKDKA